MALLRTLLFLLVFFVGSAGHVVLALAIARFRPAALTAQVMRWARFHRGCARLLLGVTSRVEGVAPPGPVLVAAKHQAMYETLELLLILDRPGVVLKEELANIPLWGRVARIYGAIPVDRAGSAGALRTMLVAGKAMRAAGRPILIFPEGTRVPPGTQPPLRAGFAGLYRMLALPVVPLALDSGRLFARGRFVRRAGVVTFRFADPIAPGLPRGEIEARVHAAINALDLPIGRSPHPE